MTSFHIDNIALCIKEAWTFQNEGGINVMYVDVMYVHSLICTSLLLLIIIDNRCGILVVSLKDIGYRVKPALHLCIV